MIPCRPAQPIPPRPSGDIPRKGGTLKDSGFSLLESVIVLTVFMILGAISVHEFRSLSNVWALEATAYAIYVDMQEARWLAVKRNKTVTLTFNPQAKTYASSEGVTRNLTNGVGINGANTQVSFTARGTVSLPKAISISNPAGTKVLDVNANGNIQII